MKLQNKLYKTVIIPTLIYGRVCWVLHKAEQRRMHTTEMKLLRWIQGKIRKDRIRNEKFRSDAMVKPVTTYVTQNPLSWYGHVMRREDTNVAKHVTTMKVGGKRPRGRPRLMWMDRVRNDLKKKPISTQARTEPRRMEKGNHGDRPRTGIRYARYADGQERQYRIETLKITRLPNSKIT